MPNEKEELRSKIAEKMGPNLKRWLLKNYNGNLKLNLRSEELFADAMVEIPMAGTVTVEQLKPTIIKDREAAEDESINKAVEATIKKYGLDDMNKLLRPAEGNREMDDTTTRDNPRHVLYESTKDAGNDGAATGDHIRVRNPSEMYSHTKTVAIHHKMKTPMRHPTTGRDAEHASEHENALLGSWIKHRMAKAGTGVVLTDHENALLGELVNKSRARRGQ